MKSIVYGTKNRAKLDSMRVCLSPLGLEIIGLGELNVILPDVAESGTNALENARLKALAYFGAIKRPVFACDSGLYIDGLPDELQPGVNVRTVGGVRLSDEQMIAHYSQIARNLGGRAAARYKNAVCLVLSEHEIYEHFGDDISGDAFALVERPHERKIPGFPLDCLSTHIETGEYYYWNSGGSDAGMQFDGFRRFFERALKGQK